MDFGKRFRTLTVLPFMATVMIASALSPLTNVVVVNARGMGHEYAQPWRSKALAGVARSIDSMKSRCLALIEATCGHPLRGPAIAGAAVLVAALIAPEHVGYAMVGVMGHLNLARQNHADLVSKKDRLIAERGAIGDAALARPAGERKMTAEENTKFLQLGKDITSVEAEIVEAKSILDAKEAQAAIERDPSRTPAVADPDNRATRVDTVQDELDKKAKAPGFFGRQLHAVRSHALANGSRISSEETQLLKMMGTATGANTDVPADGGFLVSQDRATTIIQRMYTQGLILQYVEPLPVSAGSNGTKLPAIDETSRADNSRFGGIISGWLGQGNSLTLTGKPKFREMDLKLRKVGAFVYSTDEMNIDALLFEAWVNHNLPKELQFRTEDAFCNGTGGSMPQGAFQSGSVIQVTRNTASRCLSDDLRGMWRRFYAGSRANAVWLIDQSVEEDLDLLAIPIGTGGTPDPSFKPAGSVPGQVFPTYKNRPMITTEYMAALGSTGDVALVSWDDYTAIDKGGVDQAVSLEVAFLNAEAVYRFMYRVDGQCAWNAPLTPKSGGATTSPVVVLV